MHVWPTEYFILLLPSLVLTWSNDALKFEHKNTEGILVVSISLITGMSLIVLQGPLTEEFSLLLQISLRCRMIILNSTESFLTWDWVKSKHLITWQPLFTADTGFQEHHACFVTDFVRQIKFLKNYEQWNTKSLVLVDLMVFQG